MLCEKDGVSPCEAWPFWAVKGYLVQCCVSWGEHQGDLSVFQIQLQLSLWTTSDLGYGGAQLSYQWSGDNTTQLLRTVGPSQHPPPPHAECLTEICLYRYLFAVETQLCYLCLCLVSRHTDRSEQENSKGLGTSLDYYFLQFKITYIYLFSVSMHIKRSENTWGSKFASFYCESLRHWTQAARLGSQHHSAILPAHTLLIYRFLLLCFPFFF